MMRDIRKEWRGDAVLRAVLPSAITIVGATDSSPPTSQLLQNLRKPDATFPGPVYLVNRRHCRILGEETLESVEAIDGCPGLVYMMIPGEASVDALSRCARLPEGVVLYADASHAGGIGYEGDIREWAEESGVAVFGPQSNGILSSSAGLVGLLLPIEEELLPGDVSLLAQSGGILGTLVKGLLERRVGLDVAVEYGTGAVCGYEDLALAFLGRKETRALVLHVEAVSSLKSIERICRTAAETHKPLLVLAAGTSDLGSLAAQSHSGAVATPERLVADIIVQSGGIYVETLDDLIWGVMALKAIDYVAPTSTGVLVVSSSGGGAVLFADALQRAGIWMPSPTREVEDHFRESGRKVLNPFDFGGGNIGNLAKVRDDLVTLASDSPFGICALISTLGVPKAGSSVHIEHIRSFVATINELGKTAVVMVPGPLRIWDLSGVDGLEPFVLGAGTAESASMLKVLSAYATSRLRTASCGVDEGKWTAQGIEGGTLEEASEYRRVLSGSSAQRLLTALPVIWPRGMASDTSEDIVAAARELQPPYVLKTESGLAHRAVSGGVLTNVQTPAGLTYAASFLLEHFGGEVSLHESITYDREYFVGMQRTAGREIVLVFGLGGDAAERTSHVILVPATVTECERLVAATVDVDVDIRELTEVLMALQTICIEQPGMLAVDMNPLVRASDGRLFVLDAKVHVSALAAAITGTTIDDVK